MSVAIAMAVTLGYDPAGIAELLPQAEVGLIEGIKTLKPEYDTEPG